MTVPDGYYDQSYPPSLWAPPVPPPVPPVAAAVNRSAAEQSATSPASPGLVVLAGTPGTYSPAVSASERPRNVTELSERARPSQPDPWPAGQYVPVGTSGKRAHWTGEQWRGGESPGYATEGPAGVVFPGVDDSPQDQHR